MNYTSLAPTPLAYPTSAALTACGITIFRALGRLAVVLCLLGPVGNRALTQDFASASPYAKWERGPSRDTNFFPIAVWLQDPRKARRFADAGFNTYVGLWNGPTEAQLTGLRTAGMKVICEQNDVGLKHLDDATIIGWMHGDEPDNAQSLGANKGYGPPIPPERIVSDYARLRAADPSRPVMLNLGQGVAWDGYYGRGVRTGHPEDYVEYAKGGDIISFDIYPVVHDKPEVAGNLWFVPRGVERLVLWTGGKKVVWNCIECTRIQHPTNKATPQQVRAEVWMSLVHGSRGLIYFVHEWTPKFNESALLDDPVLLPAVATLNRQITRLASVLNLPSSPDAARLSSDNAEVPLALMVKRDAKSIWLFAVGMRGSAAAGTFSLPGLKGPRSVEVLDEGRTIAAADGAFKDRFEPWGVHLYRVPSE